MPEMSSLIFSPTPSAPSRTPHRYHPPLLPPHDPFSVGFLIHAWRRWQACNRRSEGKARWRGSCCLCRCHPRLLVIIEPKHGALVFLSEGGGGVAAVAQSSNASADTRRRIADVAYYNSRVFVQGKFTVWRVSNVRVGMFGCGDCLSAV